jgi:hypothetical protein
MQPYRRTCLIDDNVLKSVLQESDLGVKMSYKCDWKDQIEKAVGKANRMASWVFRNTVSRTKSVLLPIYKSLVRPHLEYCVQLWSPSLRNGNWTLIMSLENCQRRFTKRIEDLEHLSYKERLLRLGLTTLLERRARGDLIETFKIIKGIVNYGAGFFRYSRSGRNLLHLQVISLVILWTYLSRG